LVPEALGTVGGGRRDEGGILDDALDAIGVGMSISRFLLSGQSRAGSNFTCANVSNLPVAMRETSLVKRVRNVHGEAMVSQTLPTNDKPTIRCSACRWGIDRVWDAHS